MTPATLISDLKARGVELQARGDKLLLRPLERLNTEELEAIRQCKPVIMKLLRSEGQEAATISCGAHSDPAGWTYTPDRYRRAGWRTVHCHSCGKFIGYQPPQRK